MNDPFPPIAPSLKTGQEPFHQDGRPVAGRPVAGRPVAGQSIDCALLDFWRWSASDLVSNATRGRLAEFIVALALGLPLDAPRQEWDAYDLLTSKGLKIEVKSAAYLQSWTQKKLSVISFRVPKTHFWDAATGEQSRTSRRQADIYVFALLKHTDKPSLDPLNLSQWEFYVLPAAVLNARRRSQHSITLNSLRGECGAAAVSFDGLAEAVQAAAGFQ